MTWQKVVLTLGLTAVPTIAGVTLVALGHSEIGLLLLGIGSGSMMQRGSESMTNSHNKAQKP